MGRIPRHAKKVFSGIIFDAYQWKQKMFDGSTQIYEALRRMNTVGVIGTQDGKIVLCVQEQPGMKETWTLLGGRQEKNETALQCAKRELLEEAGMASDEWELLSVSEPSHKIDWKIYLYVARNCRTVAMQTLDPGERIRVVKVSFERFLEIASSEKFRDTYLSNTVLRMRLDQKQVTRFREKLIGS